MLIYHLRNNMPKWLLSWMSAFALFAIVPQIHAQSWLSPDLGLLTPGSTKAVNALWGENPPIPVPTTNVVVADLKGPRKSP